MLAGILLLASIALIVAKAAGLLAISWFVALIPAAVLLALGAIGAIAALIVAALAAAQVDKADKARAERATRYPGTRF